jgi:hypothetical protein
MVELEALDFATGEEATLTDVKVEVFERAIAEAHNGVLLTDGALGVVARRLGGGQAMQHGQPHNRLRLKLQPLEEVVLAYFAVRFGELETAAHRGLDVRAAECGHLAQLFRNLYECEIKNY